MLFELPRSVLLIINLLGIPLIHLGVSWLFTRLPTAWFQPCHFWFSIRSWERDGISYQSLFRVRQWKPLLPDGAAWFDGFAKKKLATREPGYLHIFLIETCRSEAAHYAQIAGLSLLLIWNPWPVSALAILLYAFASNAPCIIVQRFTRARLYGLLSRVEGRSSRPPAK